MKQNYLSIAKNYIIFLQKHEKAPLMIKEEFDGKEDEDFMGLWKGELTKNKQAIFFRYCTRLEYVV